MVGTRRCSLSELGPDEGQYAAAVQHEALPFVSYPYEWSFGMLRDAALLTLDLTEAALGEGVATKYASAYNVQFRGASPVFIDVGSFERSRPGEPWYGYLQFCQQLLYPLMLQAYRGVDFHPLLRGNIEGISPDQATQLFSLRDGFRRGVVKHVHLHARLQRSYGDSRTRGDVRTDLKRAGFNSELVKANLKSLRKVVERLSWDPTGSTWISYRKDNTYSDRDTEAKSLFVARACARAPRRRIWDLGANDGHFSRIAAAHSDYVVAFDSDHLSVEALYRGLSAEANRSILPLVMDLASPSPALGWRHVERKSLGGRGRPDLVLALALVHHLAISRNVPLTDVVGWLADLAPEVVVEFPLPQDPQVARLLRNKRRGVDFGYSRESFDAALRSRFRLDACEALPSGTRLLYHATARDDLA